jgi:predicted nuclease of predicted toxin-antitoxin system
VTPADWKLLTDENLHPEVSQWLRREGFDVLDVKDEDLFGASDLALVRRARAERRIILTHDRDFGRLIITSAEPVTGIVYLRPGHLDPRFTIGSLRTLFQQTDLPAPPFIIVVERSDNDVRLRLRAL